MSKRRKPGDVVWKLAGAGFGAPAGLGLIPQNSVEPEPCFLCDDPECNEWPDVWPLDEKGEPTGGNWCHVSECQMGDAPNTNSPTENVG